MLIVMLNLLVMFQKLHLLKHLTQRTLTHWTKESLDAHKHLSMSSLILDMQSLQVRSNYGTMIVPSDNYVYVFSVNLIFNLYYQLNN